jgi:hypothetical protein
MADICMDVNVALAEVPINLVPLVDDTDFKTIESSVAYNAAGISLIWNFVTTAGAMTQTAVTPSNSGNYLWTNQGNGLYSVQVPASGGASINNNAAGFGWFSGRADGVLPWRGPTIMLRAAAVNDALIDGGDLLDVSVTQWNGTNVATPDTAGFPKVTIKSGTGTGELSLSSGRVALQSGIRKNQAIANFPFLMTDSTNHNPAAGLTVSGSRSIDGGAFGSGTIANMTEVGNGVYQCDLGAGDLNGDTIVFRFTASGADDLVVTLVTDP